MLVLISCPEPALSQAKGLVTQVQILGFVEVLSLVIVSVQLQIRQC